MNHYVRPTCDMPTPAQLPVSGRHVGIGGPGLCSQEHNRYYVPIFVMWLTAAGWQPVLVDHERKAT
jgi:hypothetical protein